MPMDDDTQNTLASVFGKLEIHLGGIGEKISEQNRLAKMQATANKAVQPVLYRLAQSAPVPAAGSLVLRFGGPDQGHVWYVRSITVGGLSPTVAAAGRADVYVSAMDLRQQTSLGSLGLADWRDQAPTLPNIAFYGKGELPLRLNEELYVVFSSNTPAQNLVAVAQVEDFEESAAKQDWSL